MTNTEITICKKHNILLRSNKNKDTFNLLFKIKNTNIQICNVMNYSLYELMGKLNEDVFESSKIMTVHSNDVVDILLIFKRFGAEVGLSQKYMFIQTQKVIHGNQIQFISKTIPFNGVVPSGCEQVGGDFANMYIDIVNPHEATIQYIFNINLSDDLPIYMENIIGLLIKKEFFRLKTFIENIK